VEEEKILIKEISQIKLKKKVMTGRWLNTLERKVNKILKK
jgi:hypothetical protein